MLTPHIVRMPNILESTCAASTRAPKQFRGYGPTPPCPCFGAETHRSPGRPLGQPPAATPLPPGTPAVPPAAIPGAQVAPPEPRQTDAAVTFAPSPVTLPAGGPTAVNIVVNGNDIFAADLILSYDPMSLTVREVREGGFLSRDGQLVATVQRLETESGTVRVSLERPPGAAPVSGTGNLVTLVLEPGSRRSECLRVTDFRIRDALQTVQVGRAAEVRVTVP